MDIVFINEARKIWGELTLNKTFNVGLSEMKINEKLLNVFHIGPFYYYILDITNFRFHFLSPKIKEVLGYDAEKVDVGFLMSKIHPDDQAIFINHEDIVVDFFNNLPIEKFTKYKVSYDYRILNNEEKYIRILHQAVVLQYDDDKKIHCILGVHTDITNIKTDNQSRLSFIGLDGEISYINVTTKENYSTTKDIFSKREKEILNYLIKGKQSTEIAKILSISLFTVHTHRKNILAKTDTKNTPELINKVITEGLL
jgi:DNA-binding CsgD family transcriptional regulator